jgi:hypothetical protein
MGGYGNVRTMNMGTPTTSSYHACHASDGSVGTGRMGKGFVWVDHSKYGSEHIGREEEGTSSGRSEMGTHTVILRLTPDHEDLITADILKYILAKLAARMTTKSRTFLVKVKVYKRRTTERGSGRRTT